jgi:hypothetical protein
MADAIADICSVAESMDREVIVQPRWLARLPDGVEVPRPPSGAARSTGIYYNPSLSTQQTNGRLK